MKKILLYLTLVLNSFSICISQNQNNEINLEDLQVPNSPAFILLDAAPTSVEKPTSSKAFGASILNSLNQNNGIPKNYAVEFTPFWFVKHPNLSALDFIGIDPKTKEQKPWSYLDQFSISFAMITTKPANIESNVTITNISFGVRSTLFKYRDNSDKTDLDVANEGFVNRLKQLNNSEDINNLDFLLLELQNNLDTIPKESDKALSIKKRIETLKISKQELINSYSNDKILIKSEELIKDILSRRPIFAVEAAFAYNRAFDNNDFSSNRLGRLGIWLNLAYAASLNKENAQIKKDYLNIIITARYLNDNNLKDSIFNFKAQNLFDSGGKLEFEFDRFSISYEYLYRYNFSDKDKTSFRSSGLIKYKINDGIYLTGAIGKNFGDNNNLITQFGINWGLGSGNEKVQANN